MPGSPRQETLLLSVHPENTVSGRGLRNRPTPTGCLLYPQVKSHKKEPLGQRAIGMCGP